MATVPDTDADRIVQALSEVSKDGEEGVLGCAERVERPELKRLFRGRAAE